MVEADSFSPFAPDVPEDEYAPDTEPLVRKLQILRKSTDRTLARLVQFAENEEWYRFGHELFELFRSLEGVLIHFGLVEDLPLIEKLKAHVIRQGRKYR